MRHYRLSAILLILLLLSSGFAVGATQEIKEIKAPTFSQPFFVKSGGDVEINIDVAEKGLLKEITLSNSNTHRQAAPIIVDLPLSEGANKNTFSVPSDIEPGLYDMCVSIQTTTAIQDCQRHSVAVVDSFDPPFKFVQITDYHVGDPRAEKQFPGVDIQKVRRAALEKANELKPDFVIMTGDITAYPRTYDVDYPAAVDEILDNIKEPVLIIPGNHDRYTYMADDYDGIIEGDDYWARYFGAKHRVLDYGRVRFVMFNSYDWDQVTRNRNRPWHLNRPSSHTYQGTLSKSEYAWVKKALKTGDGRMPVLVAHHDPRSFEVMPQQWCKDCISRTKFLSLIRKAKVPYYLFGHIHRNEEYTVGKTHYIATTSSGSDVDAEDLWCIREFTVGKDLKIESRLIKLFDSPPMK